MRHVRTHTTKVIKGERQSVPLFIRGQKYGPAEIIRRSGIGERTFYNWRRLVLGPYYESCKDIPTLLDGDWVIAVLQKRVPTDLTNCKPKRGQRGKSLQKRGEARA